MFRNFITTITRFKTATLLNIIGLSTAFIAFSVIMLQVSVEYSFDQTYKDADKIYVVQCEDEWEGKKEWYSSLYRPLIESTVEGLPDISQWAMKHFSSTAFGTTTYKVDGEREKPIKFTLGISPVNNGFIDMFGMELVEGKFDAANPAAVLIPLSVVRSFFHGESAVGQTISVVDGESGMSTSRFLITGVYRDFPANSSFGNELYGNVAQMGVGDWNNGNFTLFVKLESPGTAPKVAQLLADTYHKVKTDEEAPVYRLLPITELYFSTDSSDLETPPASRERTNIFTLIALLVIAIATINYINFASALVPLRIKGINTRKVFGATDRVLRMQVIIEAVGISLLAYLAALFVVVSMKTLDAISFIPIQIVVADHLATLCWIAVIALGIGVVAGLYPAFYSTSFKTAYVLKGSFGLSPRGKMLRTTLVSIQYIISMGLIIAAIFMNLQYDLLRTKDLGFEREHILNVKPSIKICESGSAFISELRTNAEIRDVTYTLMEFFSNAYQGWQRECRDSSIVFSALVAESQFMNFFDIKLIEGEGFKSYDDTNERAGCNIIFNRTAQRKFNLNLGDSVGRAKVIGFMEDVNTRPLHAEIEPFGICTRAGIPAFGSTNFYVKCQSDDYRKLCDFIETTGRKFDPEWMANIAFMDERIEHLYQNDFRATQQVTIFSALAIIISLLGVFGLVVFETGYRRKEIGLRKIHGATIASVLTMFNRRFVWIILGCFAVAAPVAWYGVREWLQAFAYRTPLYWWVFALALLVVLTITVVTVTVQSWRAATENPVEALKAE